MKRPAEAETGGKSMKLIDADKLERDLESLKQDYEDEGCDSKRIDGIDDCIEEIRCAKPVDSEPVVHAHWIGSGLTSVGYKRRAVLCDRNGYVVDGPCLCSNCGAVLIASDEYAVKGRYCPNCGAKMDS